jgi:hypothetical protein
MLHAVGADEAARQWRPAACKGGVLRSFGGQKGVPCAGLW